MHISLLTARLSGLLSLLLCHVDASDVDLWELTSEGLMSSIPVIISNKDLFANGSLLELKIDSALYKGNLLQLISVSNNDGSFIKTFSEGVISFELSTTGYLTSKGLNVRSGGIRVDAGGIHVEAGGIRVKGGMVVESGGLHMKEQHFTASKIAAVSKELTMPLLEAKAQSESFIGDLLSLDAVSYLDFNFISSRKGNEDMFSVNYNGDIYSAGSAKITGRVFVGKDLAVKGRIFFDHSVIKAGEEIFIPEFVIYIEIVDDGMTRANKLMLPEPSPAVPPLIQGQLRVITNMDADTTSGPFAIPFNSSILLVHNGLVWRSIDALKVTQPDLENITSFTARNDLSIGNVTFSAQHLRSLALSRGSVAFVGPSGALDGSKDLLYQKETLIVKNLRAHFLSGDIDADSNYIRNIKMSNAKIESGSVSASEISIPGQHGLAVFSNGRIEASSKIPLDSHGRLAITDIYSDIDVHSHKLSNLVIRGGRMSGISSASVEDIVLPNLKPDAILSVDNEFHVISLHTLTFSKGVLHAPAIGGFSATGPIDINSQIVSNVAITSGYISNVDLVSGRVIQLLNVEAPESNQTYTRLVKVDSRGELHVIGDREVLYLGKIEVKGLEVDEGITLGGSDIVGVRSVNAESGIFSQLTTDDLTIKQQIGTCQGCSLVGANASGKIVLLEFEALMENAVSSRSDFEDISLRSILFKSSSSGILSIGTDGKGSITDNIDLSAFRSRDGIVNGTLTAGVLNLPNLQSSLLGTNAVGNVVKVETISLKSVSAEKIISRGAMKADSLSIESLVISDSDEASRVLVIDTNGNVGTTKSISIPSLITDSIRTSSFEGNSLRLSGSHFLSTQDTSLLSINKHGDVGVATMFNTATLNTATIESTNAKIESLIVSTVNAAKSIEAEVIAAKSISTKDLKVDGIAQFMGDIFVQGSVSVEGSVIGSGPYVDSSDLRFKRNIEPIQNALDQVCQLTGVYFDYRIDEFPDKNFSADRQIGWIADDVRKILPNLVIEDKVGFQAVAYARATAVVAEAVKELRIESLFLWEKTSARLESLLQEVNSLRKEVRDLKDRISP